MCEINTHSFNYILQLVRNSILLTFFFFNLVIFPQVGETCPYCEQEEGELIFSQGDVQTKSADVEKKQGKKDKAKDLYDKAKNYANYTENERDEICSENPGTKKCNDAKYLADEAKRLLKMRKKNFDNAREKLDKAKEALKKALKRLDEAVKNLLDCVSRGSPGPCLKCSEGVVVVNNDDDPGECLKCDNGEIVADNDEDPGDCLKCDNKQVVADNDEIPGPCLYCDNKVVKERCIEGEQCCDGVCEEIVFAYRVTKTVRTCVGSAGGPIPGESDEEVLGGHVEDETYSYWSTSCNAGTTGDLVVSKGGCKGSETTITCDGPQQLPCGANISMRIERQNQFIPLREDTLFLSAAIAKIRTINKIFNEVFLIVHNEFLL